MESTNIGQVLPASLSTSVINAPETIIEDFLWQYSFPECKKFLWDWLVAILQDKDTNAGSSILFYESLLHFIEASYQRNEH